MRSVSPLNVIWIWPIATRNNYPKLSSPAFALMNRLSFFKKFLAICLISLAVISVALYNLYPHTNQVIDQSHEELKCLVFTALGM